MTMTAQEKANRLALIKKIAEKKKRQEAFKKKLAAQGSSVRRWTDEVEKPRRKKAQDAFEKELARMDENHNAWTDASKYAEQYYGETMRETTRFDNDWN
jgi:hypothetical protein